MTKALTADIHSQEQQHHDGLQSQPEFGLVRGLNDSHSTTVHLRFLDAARQSHHGRILAVLQQSYASTTDDWLRNPKSWSVLTVSMSAVRSSYDVIIISLFGDGHVVDRAIRHL